MILLHLFIIIFYAATISIDLSVAFALMNHNILLFECPSIWQRLTVVERFSGDISEQTPVTLFNGVESEVKMLHSELPQELIMGLFTFSVFTNDL